MTEKTGGAGPEASGAQDSPDFAIPARNCSTCTFYHHERGPVRTTDHARHKLGECRKYAPRPTMDRAAQVIIWPKVSNLTYCHEYVQADD